ncbi:cobalamin-binding protein [Candidatus Bathyarchaeota archaeon]|nr:MAG: cobalamin-binding protein [Candidatus Bathyarchaeota archaeon]RLG94364.1 MAG: cobalamin-binding protein [Candidatus Bathyarchaeota archaeon]
MVEKRRQDDLLEKIKEAIVNLDIDNIQKLCKEAVDAGIPAYKVVTDGMAKGMDIVGQKYEANEYFLAELIMAGETMKEGMKVLEPYLKTGEVKRLGKVVIGTVRGDLHDIGKNIAATLLRSAGFDVIDLGVDVSPEQFVEAVRRNNPDIVAMSALLTTTMTEMENTIKALKEAGLRDKVKIIIGGAPITPEYAEKIGADAAAKDAVDGVNICKSWVSKK